MDYMNPNLPRDLPSVTIPNVIADDASLKGYGLLVPDSPQSFPIEIVRWPAVGWRPVDEDCGDEAGTKQGEFFSHWDGDILFGTNQAVGGSYVLGYNQSPESASTGHARDPHQILIWHCNYHPDGGQLFFPIDRKPFVVPLALPGDDRTPQDFVCFWFDGTCGLYIHPNVWHEGVFPIQGSQRFFDKQGAVHARVSIDFAREFKCLLRVDITSPTTSLTPKS